MNPKERDNGKDRKVGAHWERQFCNLAAQFGKTFTPHQIGRPDQSAAAYSRGPDGWSMLLLPDVTVWSAPGEHHEIKHKNRTRDGMYGLERYRLDALVRFANTTGQPVYYTIHDWEIAGASSAHDEVPNNLTHWFVGDIAQLSRGCTKVGTDWTYYGGGQRKKEMWYWSASRLWFRPLGDVWLGLDEQVA
jgi:hypothetical protein